MIISKNARSFLGLSSVLAIAASSFACSAPAAGEDFVEPRVETVNRTHQHLDTGALKWANGTYGAGCQSRTGSWSARISGSDPMDNPSLGVVKNNTACVLTLTSLVADADYLGSPSIEMSDTYASSGSAFATSGGSIAFYANAELSGLSFSSAFTMTVLFSDNLADTSPAVSATYAAVSGSASESQVPSPAYTASFSGLTLQTDINGIVQLASGNVAMTATGQTGESYVISTSQSLGAAFADIDAAYAGGSPATLGGTIGVSAFGLGSAQLPTVRNIIISHTESGVTAYEVIRVTFNAP